MNIKIHSQPDDLSCGPTSLQAVYNYYSDSISVNQVIREVTSVETGGTLAAHLGDHALKRGYDVTLYVYNLNFFDPTWFNVDGTPNCSIIDKLQQQLKYKKGKRFSETTDAFESFLQHGGNVVYSDLTHGLLDIYIQKNMPIITGLSATYLYSISREYELNNKIKYDDLRGVPTGHFVVLCGHSDTHQSIIVADPHQENPLSNNNYYEVPTGRLINAIMLGVLTYDANLLIIKPRDKR